MIYVVAAAFAATTILFWVNKISCPLGTNVVYSIYEKERGVLC